MRKKHTHFTFHISHFLHVSTTDCVGLFATAIISPRQSSNIRYLSPQSKVIATKAINKAKLRYYKYFVIKMNTTHSQIVSFIWSIADDVLRNVFLRGQYRDVILPMVVFRNFEYYTKARKLADNDRDILELDHQSSHCLK